MTALEQNMIAFCTSVKNGFGSIKDSSVKGEFERLYEKIESKDLGKLLAILEKNSLIDKKFSVNNHPIFYQSMYKKINEET